MKFVKLSYWLCLTSVFVAIAIISGGGSFTLKTNTVWYDLAVGFFSSSVFMVVTIVFLSWLLDIREERDWQNVHDMVYERIQSALESLFYAVLTNVEGGNEIRFKLMRDSLNQAKGNSDSGLLYFQQLEMMMELRQLKPIGGTDYFFADEEWFNVFFDPPLSKLSDIELRYPKLPAEIVESLMKINRKLELIKSCILLDGYDKKAFIQNLRAPQGLAPSDLEIIGTPKYLTSENHKLNVDVLMRRFHGLLEEIYTMHKLGIPTGTKQINF